MSTERDEGLLRVLLVAIFCISGIALVVTGHDEGYWFFVGVVWILFGII